jgi:hypothetical protein
MLRDNWIELMFTLYFSCRGFLFRSTGAAVAKAAVVVAAAVAKAAAVTKAASSRSPSW